MENEHEINKLTDIFFDIYKNAKISGKIYHVENYKNKNIVFLDNNYSYIHIFQGGSFKIKSNEQKLNETVHEGDVIVIPSRFKHSIEIIEDKAVEPVVITCVFQLDGVYGQTIAEGLPNYILVPSHQNGKVAEWIPMTVAAIKLELDQPSLGSQVMLSSVIDLLLVWSIRFWLNKETLNHKSWISALQNPTISKALFLMHSNPAKEWTVETLAKETNQSKSKFSKSFIELVGTTPINYLKHWRMKLANQYLIETNKSISQISDLVGYSSPAAFTRSFIQTFGYSPRKFREISETKTK
ncbi:TPA: helix-turn-helix transcriptional regulator [Acinetobacter nosocomialis]|uniref:Helix-turn-helix domain-containing protein n=1 Tax=Acinetobacter nosocomialis TaxID=106654 RepID=A0AB37CW15_ACINO|nr:MULTISPECIES: AraC family transcriptional regulator [Acinetobacter calcoaceticus/baumannii complex]ELW84860.1 DNA-binding helix-turn-helix protein [Acinetobacter sp. OIFC021]EXE52850.1 bacterial regulatory helix-turn-helix s, AraC family protein [Acinetobacter sp. 766875]MBP1483105.1 helix-turn-helix transcriptional regulator [Acinetobacter nosocomialis]MDE1667053.1 AraC family transcriptional regulator [Acinetobacter nosocomialis]MDE9417641.1 AraC family transcriptional regulator [Acinetob